MKRLLVIDDDAAFRTLLCDYFSEQGYSVDSAGTGDEGLRLAKELRPDAILLDVMMPNVSGIEVLRSLQSDESTRAIPILVLTGSHFDFTMKDLFKQEGNCRGFLSKTTALNQIAGELEAVLPKQK